MANRCARRVYFVKVPDGHNGYPYIISDKQSDKYTVLNVSGLISVP